MGIVLGTLGDLGYGFAYRVLDARYAGVPQKRRRVIIVGHLGDGARAGEVLLEPEGGWWDIDPRRAARKDSADGPGGGPRSSGVLADSGVVAALTSSFGDGGADAAHAQASWLIPEVAATLTAGVSASEGVDPPGRRREDDTNLVVRLKKFGVYEEDEVASTVQSRDYKSATDLVVQPSAYSVYPRRGQGADLAAREIKGAAPALTATGEAESTDRGTFLVDRAYPISWRGRGIEVGEAEVANALRSGGDGHVGDQMGYVMYAPEATPMAIAQSQRDTVVESEVVNHLSAGGRKPGQGYAAVRDGMLVRRLMPLECERLQAFPDGWTLVPNAKGKPMSDSARYRMLGNALCVSIGYLVLSQIVAVHFRNRETSGTPTSSVRVREAVPEERVQTELEEQLEASLNYVRSFQPVVSVVKGHNPKLIAEIARLYMKPSDRVLDMTYGRGVWWRKYNPLHLVTNDLYEEADLHLDYRVPEQWEHLAGQFNVVAFDPPYISTGNDETSTLAKYGPRGPSEFVHRYGLVQRSGVSRGGDFHARYGLTRTRRGPDHVKAEITEGIRIGATLLVPGGRLIAKCCDYVEGGKKRWGHRWTLDAGEAAGLEHEDEFIHFSGTGPQPGKNPDGSLRRQEHTRRAHSFALVFRRPMPKRRRK